jgi:hypothetical protein
MRFKIFDNYFLVIDLDSNRITIISVKRKIEKVLRPIIRSNNLYYSFYFNGAKKEYSLKSLVDKYFR